MVSGSLAKSPHYDFYKQEVDRAIKDCGMWSDRVRLIVYTTIITETCDGRPFGWLNYTNPREPQFANYKPNDGDPPDKSWTTQRSGGMFQQQPQFWGPDVMDPYKTTVSFLIGYRFPDGRTAAGLNKYDYMNLPIHVACQKVQGSEFGNGSNYNRNVPFAQMVIDSDKESQNWWKGWFKMANWDDPDAWIHGSFIPMGGAPDNSEPIVNNWVSTNRAVYKYIPDAISNLGSALSAKIDSLVKSVADEILDKRRWAYWNQEGVPAGDQGTNNLTENVFATNGRVYHPQWGNKALSDKLDLLVQIAQVEGNPEIAELVKAYNETHVATVPVVPPNIPPTKPVDGTNPPSPKAKNV